MVAPPGLATRPATARVRQSIFSRLAARMSIAGARVLDLYAGSGSLGIEALSRGAASVVFVDSSRDAGRAIERNLEQFGLRELGRLLRTEVDRAIDMLAANAQNFDLIFIDAPFADDRSVAVARRIVELALLAEDGWIVVRQTERAPEFRCAGLMEVKTASMGGHRIALYRRAEQAPKAAAQT